MLLSNRPISLFALLFATISAVSGCDGKITTPSGEQTPVPAPEFDSTRYTDQLKELYEQAKDAGENVSDDVTTWAKDDVKKIGSWDYKIESFPHATTTEEVMLSKLQELGSERWECFWVEETSVAKRFYFKKSVRSYIQRAGKAFPFIPMPGKGE